MSTVIAQTAVVDPRAKIGNNVRIGHFCVIGANVSIGDGTLIEDHVVISGVTSIGEDNHIFPGTVIGAHPQDTTYRDSPTRPCCQPWRPPANESTTTTCARR